MSLYRRAAHRDAAEPAIITALRAVGATVVQLSGKDLPDLLVGRRGVTYLLEVKSVIVNQRKDGYARRSTTKVSSGQQELHARWRGAPIHVVTSVDEALAVLETKP